MIDPTTLLAFLAAVWAIQLVPGPDMMLVIARGVGQGRRTALTCVAGISAAGLVQVPALALGVGSLFETSPVAYAVLKNVGAVYLVYLGVRFIRDAGRGDRRAQGSVFTARAAFFQGFWNNLTNPKSLVFLLAFVPQFVDPARGSVAGQFIVLGIIHKSCGLIVDSSVAFASGTAGSWLKKHERLVRWQERFVGTVLLAMGLRLAFERRG